jgi:hypothetical protein
MRKYIYFFAPTQTNTKIDQLVCMTLRVSGNKSARLEERCTNYVVWNIFAVALSTFLLSVIQFMMNFLYETYIHART